MASSTNNPNVARALDFSTIKPGIPFRIDGVLYELRHPEAVPWLQYRQYAEQYKAAGPLMTRIDDLTTDERAALDVLLVPILEALTNAPAEQLQRLQPDDKLLLVANFSALWMQTSQAPGAATLAEKFAEIARAAQSMPKTGPSRSPGSRISTPVRRRGSGSRKRR